MNLGRVVAIVPAAGLGTRFGAERNKPLFPLLDKPLVIWTLEALATCPEISEIVPVFKEEDIESGRALIRDCGIAKVKNCVMGGRERQDSVLNALRSIEGADVAVIHDGARPMVDHEMISRALQALEDADGAVAGVPVKDTIKAVRREKAEDRAQNPEGEVVIERTLDRSLLWAIQTPQVFRYDRIREAYEKAGAEGFYATDDAALMERYGGKVRVVMGSYRNIKVTTPEDITIAEAFLSR